MDRTETIQYYNNMHPEFKVERTLIFTATPVAIAAIVSTAVAACPRERRERFVVFAVPNKAVTMGTMAATGGRRSSNAKIATREPLRAPPFGRG